jgi:opacity protein-like surface antigen
MKTMRTRLSLERRKGLVNAIMNRLGLIVVSALWLGCPAIVKAQRFDFGIDFSTVIPRGEFKQNISNNGYGVGGQFLVRLGRSPVSVGADLGYVNYGSERQRLPISRTLPDVTVDVRTNNEILLTHFLVRAQARTGRVQPYADGLVGFKYLVTRTTISDRFSDEVIASTKNLSDATFSYGFGGGVQIHLADVGRRGEVFLDSKVRYLRGSNADYLRKGSIRREGGQVLFDVLSSRTDVMTVQVGVTFRF